MYVDATGDFRLWEALLSGALVTTQGVSNEWMICQVMFLHKGLCVVEDDFALFEYL